jgi:hypothetical protein
VFLNSKTISFDFDCGISPVSILSDFQVIADESSVVTLLENEVEIVVNDIKPKVKVNSKIFNVFMFLMF